MNGAVKNRKFADGGLAPRELSHEQREQHTGPHSQREQRDQYTSFNSLRAPRVEKLPLTKLGTPHSWQTIYPLPGQPLVESSAEPSTLSTEPTR